MEVEVQVQIEVEIVEAIVSAALSALGEENSTRGREEGPVLRATPRGGSDGELEGAQELAAETGHGSLPGVVHGSSAVAKS